MSVLLLEESGFCQGYFQAEAPNKVHGGVLATLAQGDVRLV